MKRKFTLIELLVETVVTIAIPQFTSKTAKCQGINAINFEIIIVYPLFSNSYSSTSLNAEKFRYPLPGASENVPD